MGNYGPFQIWELSVPCIWTDFRAMLTFVSAEAEAIRSIWWPFGPVHPLTVPPRECRHHSIGPRLLASQTLTVPSSLAVHAECRRFWMEIYWPYTTIACALWDRSVAGSHISEPCDPRKHWLRNSQSLKSKYQVPIPNAPQDSPVSACQRTAVLSAEPVHACKGADLY